MNDAKDMDKKAAAATKTPSVPGVEDIKDVSKDAVRHVKGKTVSLLDEQKSKVTEGLTSVADSIRQVGENLRNTNDENKITAATARYGEGLAEKVESFSGYLEDANIKILTRDVEKFARQQPALFIGGAFLAGLLATRFLKTSAPNQRDKYVDR